MLGKNQVIVLDLFRKNIFLKTSIKNMADKLKKSYPRIYESAKGFEKEGILKIERVGRSDIVSIDLNEKSISFLSFLDEQEAFKKDIPHSHDLLSIQELSDLIKKGTTFCKPTKRIFEDCECCKKLGVPGRC